MLHARCPKDPSHRTFLTTAHVMEEWLVDENGRFIEAEQTLETTRRPHPDNIWTCATCGHEAVVTRQLEGRADK
jgi:hypothetical protein